MQDFCRIHSIQKQAKLNCSNQQPPRHGGAIPNPIWVELKWLLASPRVPVTLGTPLTQTIFLPCCTVNDRRRAAHRFLKIGCVSSLFYLSLARLLIHLLLLMSGNVHPNPCPAFPCLVCAGNVTWQGRSVQYCTCSERVHLKCSLLSFSRFRALGSSHSWSCPPCCVPACSGDLYQHGDFLLRLLQLVYLHCSIRPIWAPLANAALQSYPRLQTSYSFFAHFVSSPSAPLLLPHAPGCFSLPSASSSPSGFFNGKLAVSVPVVLNFYTLFCLIPLTLFVSRNLTLTYLIFLFLDPWILCSAIRWHPLPVWYFSY